jgi:hypothetical protein
MVVGHSSHGRAIREVLGIGPFLEIAIFFKTRLFNEQFCCSMVDPILVGQKLELATVIYLVSSKCQKPMCKQQEHISLLEKAFS